jgi:hydrogenase-4 component B
MAFITISASSAVVVIHRFASHALRRGPAWGCGFTDPTPAAQYSGASFAQPIRRVFGTMVFRARDHVDMPPPGDIRPARLRIELHDLVWERMYLPIAGAVGRSSEWLNRLQFLTIRQYLSLVFATLVTLLLVLAIWS